VAVVATTASSRASAGEPVPATRLLYRRGHGCRRRLTMIGKLDTKPQFGPVVVTVFGGEIAA